MTLLPSTYCSSPWDLFQMESNWLWLSTTYFKTEEKTSCTFVVEFFQSKAWKDRGWDVQHSAAVSSQWVRNTWWEPIPERTTAWIGTPDWRWKVCVWQRKGSFESLPILGAPTPFPNTCGEGQPPNTVTPSRATQRGFPTSWHKTPLTG